MWTRIPRLPEDNGPAIRWNTLRVDYIQRLRVGTRSAIELWPSQTEAARRVVDMSDDLVVALPTSAGKTRIAELCILRALAEGHRVTYVTPLRALSAQIERDLSEALLPLGFKVSALYGSAAVALSDLDTFTDNDVVVATPEKLDFALRNEPGVLDDVALIVLDEGHMLGPGEREVRYEALVQRLLRRPDAAHRRVVCLSALFPEPEEMANLVAWIRQDVPGQPLYSQWRPTRQRYGVVTWLAEAARLQVAVEQEESFVPRFVEAQLPPSGSRRRKRFPNNKQELTLATAWRFVEQDKQVLIYCAMRTSVEALGKLVLQCVRHGVLGPLRAPDQETLNVMAVGEEWLGTDHPAVHCLRYGVALHHGGLPKPFLDAVERLLRSREWPVVVASPTLAQGVNLSASVVLVPSIWRNGEVIPASELANVAGRAGRAFVDLEGLVLHVIFEESPTHIRRQRRIWNELLNSAQAPQIVSGLLQLAIKIVNRIAQAAGVSPEHVVEGLLGDPAAWYPELTADDDEKISDSEWERNISTLDSAILNLVESDTAYNDLEGALDTALEGSLFSRMLLEEPELSPNVVRQALLLRAQVIWSQTRQDRRQGYYAAGVGLRSGQFLDDHLNHLLDLLILGEAALNQEDNAILADTVVEFANTVTQIVPFQGPQNVSLEWQEALKAWMEELPAADVIRLGGEHGVDLLQDLIMYRIPWAMEAVRVLGRAVGHPNADQVKGLLPLAVASGSGHRSVIILMRAGLNSREAAHGAVQSTGAAFYDFGGMTLWLRSNEVTVLSGQPDWPTPGSHFAWVKFYEHQRGGGYQTWERSVQHVAVEWGQNQPPSGTSVVIEPDTTGLNVVLATNYNRLGLVKSPLVRPHQQIVSAVVAESGLTLEYFGAPTG